MSRRPQHHRIIPETFSLGQPALILISLKPVFLAIAEAARMSDGQEPPSCSTKGSSIPKLAARYRSGSLVRTRVFVVIISDAVVTCVYRL